MRPAHTRHHCDPAGLIQEVLAIPQKRFDKTIVLLGVLGVSQRGEPEQ